jgi:uncharacterized protein (TIGR03067 family)
MRFRFTIRDLLWLTVVVLFFLAGVLPLPTSFVLGGEPGDSDKEAVQKDLDGIEGTWEIVEARHNGEDYIETIKKMQGLKITFHRAPGTHEMIWGDAENSVSVVKISPSKLPKELDKITTFSGNNGTSVCLGIYELEDDLLKLCINGGQQDRPKRFTTYDERFYLVILKRVKSSTKD